MTATSARNYYGIFKTKKAKLLAIKYNLELDSKQAYIHHDSHITTSDVQFIVDNLWLDHFMYNAPKPLSKISKHEYDHIYYNLTYKFPVLFNFSDS